jgi:hypothetical protein
MSMDLIGAGGDFRIGNRGWAYLLRLGNMYGWEPMGVLFPDAEGRYEDEGDEASMQYFTNDYQFVRAEDARNLADALEKALPDVPVFRAAEHKTKKLTVGMATFTVVKEGEEFNPFEWFSGPSGRDTIAEFIAYARAGAFRIG